jgi:anti-sigma factor RsiW
MNCRRAKTLIYDFIDGMIGDQDRVSLETHLGECPSCESMATSLSKSLDLLHAVPQVQPSDNFNWKVRLGIAQARNAVADDAVTSRGWLRAWNIRFALSAASTFVVVAATGYFLTRSSVVPLNTPVNVLQNADKVAQPKLVRGSSQPASRTDFAITGGKNRLGSQFGTREVATNEPQPAANSSSLLIGEASTDSLAGYFRRTRAAEIRAQYRQRQLEAQVKALQNSLTECEMDDR